MNYRSDVKLLRIIVLYCFIFFGLTPISFATDEPSLLGSGGVLDQLYGLDNLERIDNNFDQFHACILCWIIGIGDKTGASRNRHNQ